MPDYQLAVTVPMKITFTFAKTKYQRESRISLKQHLQFESDTT